MGFTQEMQQAPVASLSGGWKMKLAIGALLSFSLCGVPGAKCSAVSPFAKTFLVLIFPMMLCTFILSSQPCSVLA